MEIQILGPVRLITAAGENSFGGAKQRTILSSLLLANGTAVTDAHIARMLWGDFPPATAAAQIYTHASRLRKHLGATVPIVRLRGGYQIKAQQAVCCDYYQFSGLVREGLEAFGNRHYPAASELLRRALRLWCGEPLADVTDHLAETGRPHLKEEFFNALEWRVEADLMCGRHRAMIGELTRLVAEHPLRERFRAMLMSALCLSDRQADAIQSYLNGRRLLADELGVDPGFLLTSTYQEILAGGDMLLPWGGLPVPS